MNANELAREIALDFWNFYDNWNVENRLSIQIGFNQWASTPEAKSLIAQLSGVGGMKWVKALTEIRDGIHIRGGTYYQLDPEEMRAVADKALELNFTPGHKCKYCGAMTTQPDEECYKAPPIPSGEQHGGWISVEDRLPEIPKQYRDEELYLVTPCNINVIVWDGEDVYEKSFGIIDWEEDITHWQPIPPPPKTITP